MSQQSTSRNCIVSADSAISASSAADTVNVIVTAPAKSRAGDLMEIDQDRFVLRQMYETLVRVDCEGRIVPRLAVSWERDETGSVWTFELGAGETFADGSPIDAAAVVAGWERQLALPSAWPRVTAVQAMGTRSVQVRFDAAEEDAPRLLSDQHFAISGPPTTSGKPSESGPFAMSLEQTRPDRTISTLILNSRGPRPPGAVLRLAAIPPGVDPRDAIDRGIPNLDLSRLDVFVTRDADLLSYAARRGEYRSVALPWDFTYALVAQAPVDSALYRATIPLPSAATRTALARDAVRNDARGAEPPFWWEQDSTCRVAAPRIESVRREVGYRAGDPIAKELAERIVALATSSERPDWIPAALPSEARARLRVTAVAADSLDDALAAGRLAAAVVAYPRVRPAGCAFAPRRTTSLIELPLVDSRAHVVARRGVSFFIDGDGGIRFAPDRRP